MYSLFPVLALLATANAAAIDRSGAALEKRVCLFGVVGLFGECAPAPATTSTAAAVVTTKASSSASASVTTKAATTNSTTVAVPTTTVAATVAIVSPAVSVVASVIECPLGILVSGACKPTTTAAASSATATTTAAGNVVASVLNPIASAASSVVAPVVNPVASAASSIVAPVVNPAASAASSILAPVASAASSVVAPVASAASSVVAPVVSAASSVVAPVASAASSVVAPVVSAASSVVAPVASAASSVVAPVVSGAVSAVAPVASAAGSVVAPVASAAASVVAPVVSSAVSVVAPVASSVSSIIASVTASSAAASSSAVTSSSVAPTTTSTSTAPAVSATPVNPSVSGWAYQGVVAEGTNGRALTGSSYAGSGMTVESCLAFCDNAGYPLAGLEYSSECYCGSTLSNGASLTKTATGGMACSGNANEACGGPSALSLYKSTKSNGAALNGDLTSAAVALPAGWSSTTCMQEVSGRAFTKKSLVSNDMTIQKCLSFCGDSKYAGLEYGTECYCADVLSNGASLTATSGQCSTPCGGAKSATCGGPSAIQVYTNANKVVPAGGSNSQCFQEVDGRLLRGASIASDNMTIDTCTSFCKSQGFAIAGLEYGRECYCDNTYFSTPLQSGQCNMNCAGNANQNCGGPNALNVFTL